MCKCALRELGNASTVGLENDLRISLPGLAAGLPTSWNVSIILPPLTLQTVTPWTKEQNDKASFNPNSGKTRDSYVKLKQGIAVRLFNRAWNHYNTIKHIRIIFAFPSVVWSFNFLPQFHMSLWEDSHLASFRWNYLVMVMLHSWSRFFLNSVLHFSSQKCRCGRLHPPVPVHLPLPLHSRAVAAVYNGEVHQCCKVLTDHSEYEYLGKKQSNTANWQRSRRSHFFFIFNNYLSPKSIQAWETWHPNTVTTFFFLLSGKVPTWPERVRRSSIAVWTSFTSGYETVSRWTSHPSPALWKSWKSFLVLR